MDLGLIDTVPEVVEFLPSGLTFLKPAVVAVRFERKATLPEHFEYFILHGSYNHTYEKTVWELVTTGIEKNNAEGVIKIKITHFSFLTYIVTRSSVIEQFMSHSTGKFPCCAYSFYHRMPSEDTIDISIFLLSKFAIEKKEKLIKQSKKEGGNDKKKAKNDKKKAENKFFNEKKEKEIKQFINDHIKGDYEEGEEGPLKTVDTNRPLELILDFPGINSAPFSFKVDLTQLDTEGIVVDHFKGVKIEKPARGEVKIRYKNSHETLWTLKIREMDLR